MSVNRCYEGQDNIVKEWHQCMREQIDAKNVDGHRNLRARQVQQRMGLDKDKTRTMILPSIRISILSYSQTTTLALYEQEIKHVDWAHEKDERRTCCKFLKITF